MPLFSPPVHALLFDSYTKEFFSYRYGEAYTTEGHSWWSDATLFAPSSFPEHTLGYTTEDFARYDEESGYKSAWETSFRC